MVFVKGINPSRNVKSYYFMDSIWGNLSWLMGEEDEYLMGREWALWHKMSLRRNFSGITANLSATGPRMLPLIELFNRKIMVNLKISLRYPCLPYWLACRSMGLGLCVSFTGQEHALHSGHAQQVDAARMSKGHGTATLDMLSWNDSVFCHGL